jgi:hypothetical protein
MPTIGLTYPKVLGPFLENVDPSRAKNEITLCFKSGLGSGRSIFQENPNL